MSDVSNIGKIHSGVHYKDAIHIAIAQVSAGEKLEAGDFVGFKDVEGVVYKDAQHIGIVDPYIKTPVNKDALFYVFLKPNTVTNLRHDWEHPLFNREARKDIAENWLKYVCNYEGYDDDPDPEYDNYSRILRDFSDGSLSFWASGESFSDKYNENKDGFRKKFWDNLEIVAGKLATQEQRDQEWFSCSC